MGLIWDLYRGLWREEGSVISLGIDPGLWDQYGIDTELCKKNGEVGWVLD